MDGTLEKELEEIIYSWLEHTFHNKDALPSMAVSSLASELSNHRVEIYHYIQKDYDLEDIAQVEEMEKVKLTPEERLKVLAAYQNSEYKTIEDLIEIIRWTVNRREQK